MLVDRWPSCDRPLVVIALSGWVDAGQAGAGALTALAEQLVGAETFATRDLADLCDLQQTRPIARFEAGGMRTIDWPHISFVHGRVAGHPSRSPRDVVLVHGPEPSLQWRQVADEIVQVAVRLDAADAFTLGGMPAIASHRREPVVLATATSRSRAQEVPPLRPDYEGPTGLQTVVQRALGDAGIGCVGLWAQVPQYVAGSPSPPAIRALLRRVAQLARLDLDLRALDDRVQAYVARVDESLAARPEVAAIVDRLDAETAPLPSGDELATEIERFLRSQGDDA